ncbi:class I SAM-dependent methyltransferase [Saccharopolyspora dendranthemae]|uniref:Methyltransferase family protein n=1 Tax=Saccharopolyspora dendranthemae TaxID=1181886 RepID=A0A561U8K8_9PSEU|nr:methyltransferase domain-containing protein [Saccharopolyspora dendranthemae]TWF95694.1 methyltransferase family protein [Saccharopolyspora dendranthemae]
MMENRGAPIPAEAFALDEEDPAFAGQALYSTKVLRVYDAVVVHASNALVWRCPARAIRALYAHHVSDAHLDVGPGTGYYVDRSGLPGEHPRLALLDANLDVLRFAAHRLRRFRPQLHAADVLKPLPLAPGTYGSIGLSYVLHCLPGDIDSKAVVFDNLKALLRPGGVLFGSTLVNAGCRHNRAARAMMRAYNGKGVFSNLDDDFEGLERALAQRFSRFEVHRRGSAALFAAMP